MSDRFRYRLGDVTHNLDSRRKPVKSTERRSGRYAYYGASGVVDHVDEFIFDGLHLLIAEDGENLRSRKTPVAFLANGRFWVNNHAHVVVGNEFGDTRYLAYALEQLDLTGYLTGSTQPKLTRAALDSIELELPSLAEQLAIAEVLGTLDDKITANATLASSVDGYLSARFDELVARKGQMTALSEVAAVNRFAVKPRAGGSLRYVDIASVGVGTYEFPELTAWSEAPGRARRAMGRGDTLWSTVRPNRRSHALNLSSDPQLVASTGLAVLSPREVGFAYLYEATRRPEFSAYLENVAEGSAYPAVRAERFLQAPIPIADPPTVATFERVAAPLREAVFAASEENRTLAATRDALLPQLMSGKLRVRDAEVAASAAGA